MELKSLESYNAKELSKEQLVNTNGGASFAYRVGQFLRFCALGGSYYAIADLAANEAKNQS